MATAPAGLDGIMRLQRRVGVCVIIVSVLLETMFYSTWPAAAKTAAPAARALTVSPPLEKAEMALTRLRLDPHKRKWRSHWLKVIAAFEAAAKKGRSTAEVAQARYGVGVAWEGLYGVSRGAGDLARALDAYREVGWRFSADNRADDALWRRAELLHEAGDVAGARLDLERIRDRYPHGDMAARAAQLLAQFAVGAGATAAAEKSGASAVKAQSGPGKEPAAVPRDAPASRQIAAPARRVVTGGRQRPLVVLDPGHGGKDTGARSRGPRSVAEKAAVLAIAKHAARYLDAAGISAQLTRTGDRFVPLAERTALANRLGANLLVSIHANAAPNKQATGVETYYLNVTSDRYALRLAAVENQTSEDDVTDLQLILADLSTKVNTQESIALARRIQDNVIEQVRPLNSAAKDLGVKASLFYVLLGARMPSVLVETAFLSNAREAQLLGHAAYQRRIARGIADAVIEHLQTPIKLVGP